MAYYFFSLNNYIICDYKSLNYKYFVIKGVKCMKMYYIN